MARFANRDPRTGRWTVDTSNTPVDSRFDPMTGIDVQVPGSSPADLAYALVGRDQSQAESTDWAPKPTDTPDVEPARPRLRTQATGLRGAYDRALDDRDLLGEAQAGTSLLPGTES